MAMVETEPQHVVSPVAGLSDEEYVALIGRLADGDPEAFTMLLGTPA